MNGICIGAERDEMRCLHIGSRNETTRLRYLEVRCLCEMQSLEIQMMIQSLQRVLCNWMMCAQFSQSAFLES